VAVECREPFRLGGREPEADVAVGADHDHAARRDAGADGIDAGIVGDLHELVPASAKPRKRLGVRYGSKNEHVVRRSGEPSPVGVALPRTRPLYGCPAYSVVDYERTSRLVNINHGARVS